MFHQVNESNPTYVNDGDLNRFAAWHPGLDRWFYATQGGPVGFVADYVRVDCAENTSPEEYQVFEVEMINETRFKVGARVPYIVVYS
ncbi:hypothetical protein [Roseibium aggregatum]|uniref:Uncharacterized protein n=1 Tax=Roseibium aggregatum TaxID=187304 RepID=A0A0M6Y8I5_9HYPH|nr:hypothetical protein [Roseibium aggregatum]CTQ45719.1 hypothetical protein LAL4801_04174 [Roseibium aggregatum]